MGAYAPILIGAVNMGLFSSSKRVSVFSDTFTLIQTNDYTIQEIALYSVFNNISIGTVMQDTLLHGIVNKVASLRRYARDEYVLGLPNTTQSSLKSVDDALVIEAVKSHAGITDDIILVTNFLTELTSDHVAIPHLISNRGYISTTGAVTVVPTEWGLDIPSLWINHVTLTGTIKVDEILMDAAGTSVTIKYVTDYYYYDEVFVNHDEGSAWLPVSIPSVSYTETIPVPEGYQIGRTYLIVGYHKLSSEGVAEDTTNWWMYNIDSQLYPTLIIEETDTSFNDSYPVIPIRYDNKFLSDTFEPEIYSTGHTMMKKMGFDTDNLVSQLDENPDIGSIDHCYIMFGINLQTADTAALSYLVDFFTALETKSTHSIFDSIGAAVNGEVVTVNGFTFGTLTPVSGTVTEASNSITTTINPTYFGGIDEYGLHVSISYDTIASYSLTGSIGEVGTVTRETVEEGYRVTPATSILTKPTQVMIYSLVLKKQISTNMYKQVKIVNLTHTNRIYDKKSVVTTLNDVKGLDPEAEGYVANNNFIIPLHHSAVQRVPFIKRAALYNQALILVITGYEITKIRWYQKSFFKAVTIAVAMIVAMWSGQYYIAALATAIGTGVTATMLFILQTVVLSLVFKEIADFVVSKLGPAWGFVIAVIAIAVSKTMPSAGFSIMGVVNATAETFLRLAVSIGKAITEFTREQLKGILEEYSTVLVDQEAKMKLLEEKGALLNDPDNMLPFSLIDTPDHRCATDLTPPSLFYNKVHIGNIGTLSLAVPEYYVTMSLALPEYKPFDSTTHEL